MKADSRLVAFPLDSAHLHGHVRNPAAFPFYRQLSVLPSDLERVAVPKNVTCGCDGGRADLAGKFSVRDLLKNKTAQLRVRESFRFTPEIGWPQRGH